MNPEKGDETWRLHESHEKWRQRAKKRGLSNESSGKTVLLDLQAATDAGAEGAEDLARTTCLKNARRDLARKLLKGSRWPKLYWADVPVKNLKKPEETKTVKLPFLLPREWIPQYVKLPDAWDDVQNLDPWLRERRAEVAGQLQVSPEKLVPIGLHGDGVPIGGNMNEDSLDVFNINLVSSTSHSALRVPFTCIQLRHLADDSFQAIVAVFCWSMRCLAAGCHPVTRHDGTPFGSDELHRRVAAGIAGASSEEGGPRPEKGNSNPEKGASSTEPGSPLGAQAFLAEIRGDWVWLQKLLKFPAWNKAEGFCWLCRVQLADLRVPDTAAAPWRWKRYEADDFLQALRAQGRDICELFSLPGVTPRCILPDWMHSADMGVGQDVAAHVFVEALEKMQGATQEARVQALWRLLRAYYETHRVPHDCRLQILELKHFVRAGESKANKLKCKAAHTRHLVPFLAWLSSRYFDASVAREGAVRTVAACLANCYQLQDEPGEELGKACRKFANAYAALERDALQRDPGSAHWRIKPKLHLFQELCEFGNRAPRLFWCYKDETFGNLCANLARRRGGPNHAGTNAKHVLEGWCARTVFPWPGRDDEKAS